VEKISTGTNPSAGTAREDLMIELTNDDLAERVIEEEAVAAHDQAVEDGLICEYCGQEDCDASAEEHVYIIDAQQEVLPW